MKEESRNKRSAKALDTVLKRQAKRRSAQNGLSGHVRYHLTLCWLHVQRSS